LSAFRAACFSNEVVWLLLWKTQMMGATNQYVLEPVRASIDGDGSICKSCLALTRQAAAVIGEHMGSFSIWHWVIVLLLVMVLFGRGKVSELMGDVANGIKSFKKGMAEDDEPVSSRTIPHDPADPVSNDPVKTRSTIL
jgi:sec-independent protein translocase protein TatA